MYFLNKEKQNNTNIFKKVQTDILNTNRLQRLCKYKTVIYKVYIR